MCGLEWKRLLSCKLCGTYDCGFFLGEFFCFISLLIFSRNRSKRFFAKSSAQKQLHDKWSKKTRETPVERLIIPKVQLKKSSFQGSREGGRGGKLTRARASKGGPWTLETEPKTCQTVHRRLLKLRDSDDDFETSAVEFEDKIMSDP